MMMMRRAAAVPRPLSLPLHAAAGGAAPAPGDDGAAPSSSGGGGGGGGGLLGALRRAVLGGDKGLDRARLAELGMGAFAAYGVISNVNAGA
jgi:hypothetical protein